MSACARVLNVKTLKAFRTNATRWLLISSICLERYFWRWCWNLQRPIKRLGTGTIVFYVCLQNRRRFKLSFIICCQARNKDQEQEVLTWISAVLGEPLPNGQYEDILKDGVVLCKLANKLAPGSVKKIQERGTNFQLMENIQRYYYFYLNYII